MTAQTDSLTTLADTIRERVAGFYGFTFWGRLPVRIGDQFFSLLSVTVNGASLEFQLRHDERGEVVNLSLETPRGIVFRGPNELIVEEVASIDYAGRKRLPPVPSVTPAVEFTMEQRKGRE